MSLFKKDQSVEETTESNGYSVLSSGVYKGIIKQAYLSIALDKSGKDYNLNLNWTLDIENVGERSFNNNFIAKVINAPSNLTVSQLLAGSTNAQIIYFSDKEGTKKEYVGFGALRRALDTLIGKSVFDEGILVDKTLPIYDFQTKANKPTLVLSIDDIVGLEAAFGIMENHENQYKDPSKVVKRNSIERIWKLVDGQPFNAEEIKAGVTEPTNCLSWKDNWTGKVNDRNLDKSKLTGGTSSKGTQALDIG